MSFSHEYNFPVIIGTGSVLTSGSTADLGKGQIGIFDAKSYQAVSGPVGPHQAMFLASGSWHNVDKLGSYIGGLTQSDKTIEFLGRDILAFERSKPRRAQSEQWIIGWDGTNDCGSLSFKTGETYRFFVKVWGEDVYGTFLKPIQREITLTVPPNADGTAVAVGTKKYAQEIARMINTDPELKYFVQAQALHDDYEATVATHNVYQLEVADEGDGAALAAVQANNGAAVKRVERNGIKSIYQIEATSLPTAFTPSTELKFADCADGCPSGYTYVAAKEGFIVTRAISASDDLNSANDQQTYASAVGLAYFPAKTFDGASAVDPTTDQITITAHALVANAAVVYSNGGFTSITGLTNGNTYYVKTVVDANNITLSATPGGTVINITADGGAGAHKLTPVITSTFLSSNGAIATVRIEADKLAVDPTALLSDSLTKIYSRDAMCTPPAASSTAWVSVGEKYRVTRELFITLPKVCGTANRLVELQEAYANDASIVADSIAVEVSGTCSDTYVLEQYSDNLLEDACLAEDLPVYKSVQSFEGFVWDADFCATEVEGASTVKAGVRLTAAYENTKFGGCSFNPNDYYSVRPLKLEVTALVHGPGEYDNGKIPVAPTPGRKVRNASMATQSGEWMIREYIRGNVYKAHSEFYLDPRLREVLDSTALDVVDRNKNYTTYHLKVKQNRGYQNHSADYSAEVFDFTIAFTEATNAAAFEAMIQAVSSQFGVFLKDR